MVDFSKIFQVTESDNQLVEAYKNYPFELKAGDYFVSPITRNVFLVNAVVPFWKRTAKGNEIYWMFVVADLSLSKDNDLEFTGPPVYDMILDKSIAEVLYG